MKSPIVTTMFIDGQSLAGQGEALAVLDPTTGQTIVSMTEADEAHMFEPHYDRHVWIYRDNPNGMFAQYNPNVTCKWHRGGEHKH